MLIYIFYALLISTVHMKSELEKPRKTKSIRNWIVEERPREMLVKQGAENVNLAKLLAIIMVHNHPSGEPEPSNVDIAITKRVADAK